MEGDRAPEERPLPAEIEASIRSAAGAEAPAAAAFTLAAIANRAIAELNKLARAEAGRRRGQAEWGAWAALANTARDAVLRTSTCRRAAADLARRADAAPAEGSETAAER